MIKAAIIGLGWWGKTLVESVQTQSSDIHFVAGTMRTPVPDTEQFAKAQGLALHTSFEEVLRDKTVDAVVLTTPNTLHVPQILAAAAAGKHVFCEKPFALTKSDAERAVAAMKAAELTLALGYNRRFHPTIVDLRERVQTGALGTLLHFEGTMTFPNALYLKADQWRARPEETPCGGMMPMGVHIVDGAIDLFGEIDEVYCQSLHRVVPVNADDTTSILFRMKNGMTGYLGTMTATGGSFRLQVYGSEGWVLVNGMTHVAGAPSEERRSRLFGECKFQPVKGEASVWQAPGYDVARAALDAFAKAASGGPAYPIAPAQMIHCVAATEAIIRSAASGKMEKVL